MNQVVAGNSQMNIGRTWKQKGAATCTKVRQIIPADILEDTFALHGENQLKLHGEFKTGAVDFFKCHIVRFSWDKTFSDVLHVQGGPLVGHEDRSVKFNRWRAWAFVRVNEGDGATATLNMPLAALVRR
jgi:hypothetical protein